MGPDGAPKCGPQLGWVSPDSERAPTSHSDDTWVQILELQVEDGLKYPRPVWGSSTFTGLSGTCHALEENLSYFTVALYFKTLCLQLVVSTAVQAGRASGSLARCGSSWCAAAGCTQKETRKRLCCLQSASGAASGLMDTASLWLPVRKDQCRAGYWGRTTIFLATSVSHQPLSPPLWERTEICKM